CPLCASSFCLRLVLSFQLRLAPVKLRSIAPSAATILQMKLHDGAVSVILAQPGDYFRPPAAFTQWCPDGRAYTQHAPGRAARFDACVHFRTSPGNQRPLIQRVIAMWNGRSCRAHGASHLNGAAHVASRQVESEHQRRYGLKIEKATPMVSNFDLCG